ncbi:MAG: 1-deoxy-D-xylulose-5-phosphate synthase [Desulfuromonadaceae bacterium]|nr:1-deoxy-D-xylulose-5-phosphate synthase [Desulfuromonadaceae bacterium]
MTTILDTIRTPQDIKGLTMGELSSLAEEIRTFMVDTVAQTGGHLASSLGVVELTLALHRVFDTPGDKIVWDVGHQTYAHKIITGRKERFPTLRQHGGLSGFPKRSESVYDCFDVGHSSTSISAALGMAVARDKLGGAEKIIAVIGDGSLTAGVALEGLNQAGHLGRNLIVVLNDNEMSISPNVGALSSFLSRKLTSDFFVRLRKEAEGFLQGVPMFGKDLLALARRAEDSLKGFLTPGMLFEAWGFNYVGPLDGHDLEELITTLGNVSRLSGPVLVHVATKKGKGYLPAEKKPSLFHGVGNFDRETGEVHESKGGAGTYTAVFGKTLIEMAEKDDRIVAITAAMTDGTGLTGFRERFPDRFFDVGIAEQHAVTFAAGLACQGRKPVVAIYSTFLQRAYDNILHDVCLQNLPVVFALDRGGLVGSDGPTHHGVFDLSFLRHMPNMTIMAPRNEQELRRAMVTALGHDGPFAFRYPRGKGTGVSMTDPANPFEIGQGEKLTDGADGSILAIGSMVSPALEAAQLLKKEGISLAVIDLRFAKPLDSSLILDEAGGNKPIITVEENVLCGGVGSAVLELMAAHGFSRPTLCLGLGDAFIEQGTQAELRSGCRLDAPGIADSVKKWLKD